MFAELHGGKLQLTSAVGEGTTVRIIFPESRVM
jgi:signal transduction histidine kinase